MKLTNSQLQKSINQLVSANNKAFIAKEKIINHCMEVYGASPFDINNDFFIDSCDSGCGLSHSISADEFHESMINSMEIF